jgi:anti-sigma factor RsiW
MTQADEPRRFSSTEHLASEAVAAFADGELRMTAYLRAARHIAECPECAAEVDAQQQARAALKESGDMSMPTSLLGLLSQIPMCEPEATTKEDVERRRRVIVTSVVGLRRRRR